jgi:segregation and condensation protein A
MLEYRRYRSAAAALADRLAHEHGYRYRSAPLPPHLRRVALETADAVYDPALLGEAVGELLQVPPQIDLGHVSSPRVGVGERAAHLRALLRRGRFTFDEAVAGADRLTVAVTLFALLELYKRGEATWVQPEPFGEVTVAAATHAPAGAGVEVG